MKKLQILLFTLFALTACGGSSDNSQPETNPAIWDNPQTLWDTAVFGE